MLNKEEFINKIRSNWSKSIEAKNPNFIQYCETFVQQNAKTGNFSGKKKVIAGNFYYKEQIDLDRLYNKAYKKFNLPLDGDEIILFVQDDLSILNYVVYVVTNENLYYKTVANGKILEMDVSDTFGHLELKQINQSVQVSGFANYNLIINGSVIGSIDIADNGAKKYAKIIESFFAGIVLNNNCLFTKESENISKNNESKIDTSDNYARESAVPQIKAQPVILQATLKPGESINIGYCPNCGSVGIKTAGTGYHPGCGVICLHILLSIITAGAWLFVWGALAAYNHFIKKGSKTCTQCGLKLQA